MTTGRKTDRTNLQMQTNQAGRRAELATSIAQTTAKAAEAQAELKKAERSLRASRLSVITQFDGLVIAFDDGLRGIAERDRH